MVQQKKEKFRFFYSLAGRSIPVNIIMSIFIGLFDGISLGLFIPIIQNIQITDQQTDFPLNIISKVFNALNIPISLLSIIILISTLFILKALLKYLLAVYQANIQGKILVNLKSRLLNGLNNISFYGFQKISSGQVQNVFNTEAVKASFGINTIQGILQNLVIFLTYFTLAFISNYKNAVLLLLVFISVQMISQRFIRYLRSDAKLLSSVGNKFNNLLSQSLKNFPYLKATNQFNFFSKEIISETQKEQFLNVQMGKNLAILNNIKEPIGVLSIAIAILLQYYLYGHLDYTFFFILVLFYRLFGYGTATLNAYNYLVTQSGAIDNVFILSQEFEKYKESDSGSDFNGFNQSISLKNISFTYPDRPVLSEINIEIKKNQSIAFIGKSGSGKTTLARIISSLIRPDSGQIEIDGINIDQYSVNSYRNKIGYVIQEPIIFNDTIYRNIVLNDRNNLPNPKFETVLDQSIMSEFVAQLPNQSSTILGDDGMLISGGQKQRIAIARELYKNIDLLILDEATSSLDSLTENQLSENIDRLKGKLTIIVIAHRLSLIKKMDVIYFLDKGKILHQGTFEELKNNVPEFNQFIAAQNF